MSNHERIARLGQMADMVFDTKAARLREAAAKRDSLRNKIDTLNRPVGAEVDDPALARFLFSYESWAAGRRAELNIQLASAQGEWLSQLDRTRRAFGQQQVLKRIAHKLR